MKGAQSVVRTLELLKAVARNHGAGTTTRQLVEQTGLNRVTVSRLLSALSSEGLIEGSAREGFSLGIASMQIGLAAMRSNPLVQRARPMMMSLARRTEDTVFLLVRNGDYGQCVHHEEGIYPVKALVLRPGDLRLLGIGSAGLALMASLPDAEIRAIHARNLADYPPSLSRIQSLTYLLNQTRQRGWSSSSGLVTEGVGGVGVCFNIAPDYHAAVSVAAISGRMTQARRRQIADMMFEEIARAEFSLTDLGS